MGGLSGGAAVILAEGSRVALRRLAADDAAEATRLLSESADFHRSWVSYPTSHDQVAALLAAPSSWGVEVFGVRRLNDGALVGVASLARISGKPWLTAECGGAVGVRYQGKGYIAEAMRLLTRFAVSDLGLHRVEALVQPGNSRSGRMFATAGFRAEGTARRAIHIAGEWRDHVRWAVTAEDLSLPARYLSGTGEGVI